MLPPVAGWVKRGLGGVWKCRRGRRAGPRLMLWRREGEGMGAGTEAAP